VQAMAEFAGIEGQFMTALRQAPLGTAFIPHPRFFETLHSRLYLGDGSFSLYAGHVLEPLSHFQLIWESPWTEEVLGLSRPLLMTYRVVPGARIAGHTDAGAKVRASIRLRTGPGRILRYSQVATAGGSGEYTFTVPYGTDALNGGTRAEGDYRIETPSSCFTLPVPEEAVHEGWVLRVEESSPCQKEDSL